MTDRRYSDEEVAAIFKAASEAPPPSSSLSPRVGGGDGDGLNLAQIVAIGREVGIGEDAVTQAARGLAHRPQAATRRLLGLPIGVERTVTLERALTELEWEHLVVELREVFEAKGRLRSHGSFREWTNGNLQVLLEPTPAGHRLRMRSTKGDARAYIAAGFGALIASAMTIVPAVLADGSVAASAAPLVLAGLGLLGFGALRVPSWARLRAQQMEEIAARLVRRIGPAD